MRIIPVIDILNGVAVHAVRGRRQEYQPLRSILTPSTLPLDVASAFKKAEFSELYIADLDAITGKGENLATIEEIAKKTEVGLMVDAGISDLTQAQKLLRHNVAKVVIGTETLANMRFIQKAIQSMGTEKIVVSLDLKAGQVLSKSKLARSMKSLDLAKELVCMGVSELIVLDLVKVGSCEGVDFDLLREMTSSINVKVLVGGGIRGIEDLAALKTLGVNGVLLATCLHSGTVSFEELRRRELL